MVEGGIDVDFGVIKVSRNGVSGAKDCTGRVVADALGEEVEEWLVAETPARMRIALALFEHCFDLYVYEDFIKFGIAGLE